MSMCGSFVSKNGDKEVQITQNCQDSDEEQVTVPCFVFGADRDGFYLRGQSCKKSTSVFVERRVDFLGSNK